MHSIVGKLQRLVRPTSSTSSMKSYSPTNTALTSSSSYTLLSSPSTTSSPPSSVKSSKKKRDDYEKKSSQPSLISEISLFFRLLRFKMPSDFVLLLVVIFITTLNLVTCEPMYQKATYISESRLAYNPYSSNSVQQHLPEASEIRPSVVKKRPKPVPRSTIKNSTSAVRRSPQWTTMDQIPALPVGAMQYHFNTNHAVMVAEGKKPLSFTMDNLTTAESQLRKEKRQIGGVVVSLNTKLLPSK